MDIKNNLYYRHGALGMLYGSHIQQHLGKGSVRFVMDPARYERHKDGRYTVNGVVQEFILTDCTAAKPADLVIVATKYGGLQEALDVMESSVGENTILMSVLNGITSEQVIAQRYADKNLIYCVAIGMGAIRDGCDLRCANKGFMQIGILKEAQRPALEAVKRFFDAVGLDYSEEQDIMHALWNKLMLNVGINQTCMVYATSYGGALKTKQSFDMMSGAMHEVIAVAQKEGVRLTEADYEKQHPNFECAQARRLPVHAPGRWRKKVGGRAVCGHDHPSGGKTRRPRPVNAFTTTKFMKSKQHIKICSNKTPA